MAPADIPEDRTYTRNHEWVKLDAAVVQMGVTASLLKAMGPVVAIELPAADDEMMVGVALGTVEFVRGVHEIMPPADATVLEVNKGVEWDLDALGDDPYGKGWLLKIKVHDPSQLRTLLVASAYREHCKQVWGEE